MRLKGKLWGEWYDDEEDEGDGEEADEEDIDRDEEVEKDLEGRHRGKEYEEVEKVMVFLLQFECVADEDDITDI